MWNTVVVSVISTFVSLAASVCAAYAIERLRFRGSKQIGLAIFAAYLVLMIVLVVPPSLAVQRLLRPLLARRLEAARAYFELPSGR